MYFDYNFLLQIFKSVLSNQKGLMAVLLPVFKNIWSGLYSFQIIFESLILFLAFVISAYYLIKPAIFKKHFNINIY